MRLALAVGSCVSLSLVPHGRAIAQDSTAAAPPPYSTLTVGIAGGSEFAAGRLDRYWSSSAALRVDVHTGFHAGEVGAFALTVPYRARTDSQPDYRAYVIGLDWRFAPGATARLTPLVSVSAGNYLMVFDGVDVKGLARESEIFVGGSAGVAARIHGGTAVTLLVTGMQVLTSTPIRSAFVTAGISQRLATPRWLRGVLE